MFSCCPSVCACVRARTEAFSDRFVVDFYYCAHVLTLNSV